ncbi:hypothetical protein BACCOPRO_01582 [Phocaeicola coprophilus DSM 18228 = JCM 13818]|uniref:Uncharacterized protein n=1 Tax=Phocaeicola coprophilus DSM 18228 = JCM 13818 TaxID=547042 RepID=S0F7P3_9BACT|nr:hypothetical protein BACCOPRO_01582 [Phocaeicola coprophilus DSM 18228 = JCM 13818]
MALIDGNTFGCQTPLSRSQQDVTDHLLFNFDFHLLFIFKESFRL